MRHYLIDCLGCGCLLVAITGCQPPTPSAEETNDQVGLPNLPATFAPATETIAEHNRGVGLMGQFNYEQAHGIFAQLVADFPTWQDVRVDLAISKLNRRQENDAEDAERILEDVISIEPENLRAKYCHGILLLYKGDAERAEQLFQAVAEADPSDAYAFYYWGQCLFDRRDYVAALDRFQQAQRLDPYLRSAYYGAFQSLQRLQRPEDAKSQLTTFQRLADNPQARSAEIKYSRMGPKAETRAVRTTDPSRLPKPVGPPFARAVPLSLRSEQPIAWAAFDRATAPSITVCDLDADGRQDLLVADGLGSEPPTAAVLLRRDGCWELAPEHPLASLTEVNAVLWGDVDNDGRVDAYVCRRGPNQLWMQLADGWTNVTETSATAGGSHDTLDGALFDADHDGDLDIWLIHRDSPNVLLNNNLDGTFRDIAGAQAVAGGDALRAGIAVADLDSDRDADVVVLHQGTGHEIYLNDRLWNYSPGGDAWAAFKAAPCFAVVAVDEQATGRTSLVTSSPRGIERWSPAADGQWIAERIIADEVAEGPLAVQDIDGDGRLDVVFTTPAGWAVATAETTYYFPNTADAVVGPWTLALLGDSRGYSIVAPVASGPPLVWHPGPGRYPFVLLEFTGRENRADEMRSNASGIGIRAAARIGDRWTALQTFRDQSGPGQSRQPVPVGLGSAAAIDYMYLLWPDGLFQTELALAAGATHRIAETQRQVSSCPVLFVWDGESYQFVTDILGVGGLGFNLSNGEYGEPRPWEFVLLPQHLPPTRAAESIKMVIAEPMEEACYLDHLRLWAVDLPPGWQVTVDERQSTGAPQATGERLFFRDVRLPKAAKTEQGQDVLAQVLDADGLPAPAGDKDPRFIAFAKPHTLTLDFAEPIDRLQRPTLIMDAWVEYPYSQTMFAAWQASAPHDAATLEARGMDGRWHMVYEKFGYPAGMPRQMSLPINPTRLPPGTTSLRLSCSMQIFRDRIRVADVLPCPEAVESECRLRSATASEVGFPRRSYDANRRPRFRYQQRQPLWDTRHQSGWYTNFGSVLPLISEAEDAVAIFGPGEEVAVDFDPPAHEPAEGWTRRFVLECRGWCKDMDLYTQHGDTLAPLPRTRIRDAASEERRERLHRLHNQRFRVGS